MAYKETATEAFNAARDETHALLMTLEVELELLDARQDAEPRDWGYAGSAGHINELLREALAFLQNCEPEDVELGPQ